MNTQKNGISALRGRGLSRYGWYVVRILIAVYLLLSILGSVLNHYGLLQSTPILLAAALLPGAVLLVYIYMLDTREKEPLSLLLLLFFGGVLSIIPALIFETIGSFFVDTIWGILYMPEVLWVCTYCIITACYVGIAEEGSKLLFLRLFSWKKHAFNYLFDGIVYAVFVSLGFAIVENIEYVLNYGFDTAVIRACVSVPGHMCYGALMGLLYSKSRRAASCGDSQSAGGYMLLCLLVPAGFHAAFDALAMISDYYTWVNIIVYVFVALLYSHIFTLIKRASDKDRPIAPPTTAPLTYGEYVPMGATPTDEGKR